MGRVASVDNSMIESFWSTMQRQLLDRRQWTTREDLATAIFEWIEGSYNPSAATHPSAACPRPSTRPDTGPHRPQQAADPAA
jgi:hypothetical protein